MQVRIKTAVHATQSGSKTRRENQDRYKIVTVVVHSAQGKLTMVLHRTTLSTSAAGRCPDLDAPDPASASDTASESGLLSLALLLPMLMRIQGKCFTGPRGTCCRFLLPLPLPALRLRRRSLNSASTSIPGVLCEQGGRPQWCFTRCNERRAHDGQPHLRCTAKCPY